MAKLPARIPVAGKNGTITGYTSLHFAPTLTPAQAARATRTQNVAGIHVGGSSSPEGRPCPPAVIR
jgi:hypothetical protein